MSSVLGVSVGASAVRLARPDSVTSEDSGHRVLPDFRAQVVAAGRELPEDLAAESIGVVLAGGFDNREVHATGVAYRDEAQAGAVQAAMARQQLGNYQLVPEASAALTVLDAAGALGDHSTLVFYDLGSSGLTVSVVDRETGAVVESTRTDTVSGDLFDRLIRDNQLVNKRISTPHDAAASSALDLRCREAKERLSVGGAVAVPGDGGLLLLSRDVFDSLIGVTVESSARLAREVIARSGRIPDAVVLTGGGARIPLVRSVLESWLALPVIVPDHPELVAAQGAALLAQQGQRQRAPGGVTVLPPPAETFGPFVGSTASPYAAVHAGPAVPPFEHDDASFARQAPSPSGGRSSGLSGTPSWLSAAAPPPSQRVAKVQIRGAALAGGALAVIALIGLGLNYGSTLLNSTEGTSQPVTTQPKAQPPAVSEMATPSPTAPPPPPTEVVEEPAATASRIQIPEPEPEPPPPPPAPVFPGLPQFQLPPLQLPPLPRIPGT